MAEFLQKNSIKTAGSQDLMFGGLVNATVGKKISEKLKSQFGGRLRVAISGGASLNLRRLRFSADWVFR